MKSLLIEEANPNYPQPGWYVVNGSGIVRKVVRMEEVRPGAEVNVVYEAILPQRPARDRQIRNQYRRQKGLQELGPFDHVCYRPSWVSWVHNGDLPIAVLSDWSIECDINYSIAKVQVPIETLKSWAQMLDNIEGRNYAEEEKVVQIYKEIYKFIDPEK